MIEFERHIEILLLSNDCVIVPGLGGFTAHHVNARYDEADASFLPPLRTLGFNPQLTMNDSLLVHSYIEAYDISYPEALRRIEAEVAELRQHLDNEGSYELNDLGVLSLNEEGNLLFEPCEAGILTPQYYGLGAVEMLPLEQAVPAAASTSGKDHKPADHAIVIKMSWLRNVAAVAAAVIAVLMMTTPVSNSVAPQHVQQSAFIPLTATDVADAEQQTTDNAIADNSLTTANDNDGDAQVSDERQADSDAADEQQPDEQQATDATAQQQPRYVIVLASQTSMRNAETYVRQLDSEGFDEARVDVNQNRVVRVVYGSYETEAEAQADLRQLRAVSSKHFKQAWVMNLSQ